MVDTSRSPALQRPITLQVCALGGEGGGVLTEWVVDTARRAGFAAQSTSIPGVAQRTGSTTYYVEVFPVSVSRLGDRCPVLSLNPLPGRLDALLSSELLETARQVSNGLVSPDRTLVITSSGRTLTTLERMQPGDGRRDAVQLTSLVAAHSRDHHLLDMAAIARESGTVVSAVMLGALAATDLFPFGREHYEATVRDGGAGAEASLRGFSAAFEVVAAQRRRSAPDGDRDPASVTPRSSAKGPTPDLPPALAAQFPPPAHAMLSLGFARVREYQDARYGELYLQRLARVLEAERAGDPAGTGDWTATREMARWLALWMAFDDIVRVADLKRRAARAARVRAEARAGDDDLLRVYDHFKPGAPEFAALLPPAAASRLLGWDRRRQRRGRDPWALPLKIGTHTVTGMAALRFLAGMRFLRPRGSRYALEQSLIERWLGAVVAALRIEPALGRELALCGRLVKGYGSTNERGKENLLHIVDHLHDAAAVRSAREAALQDEAGQALDAALVGHGAPARPVREVPIRVVRRRRTETA